MAYTEPIVGRYVDLRPICEKDAKFSLEIRQDPEFSKYLPKINNSLEQQIEWIKKQKEKPDDYFFIVYDKNGEPIGTVGVFDVYSNPPKVGRLAMKGNALQNIEATMLAYHFGLYDLNLEKMWGFIYTDNIRAIRFAKEFGAILYEPKIDSEGRSIREVIFRREEFSECEKKLSRILYR